MLQKEVEHTPSAKMDAAAAFLASLEEPKLTSLADAGKKPPIEILPPGMPSLSGPISLGKKPAPAAQNTEQQQAKPLLLEGSSTAATPPSTAEPSTATTAPAVAEATPTTTTQPESGEPISADTPPVPSTSNSDQGNLDQAGPGESISESSTNKVEPSEASTQVPEIQETNVQATVPMADLSA